MNMRIIHFLSLALVCGVLAGCTPSSSTYTRRSAELPDVSTEAPAAQTPAQGINRRPVKVGLLLPLSGSHATLGQAMLNAAQMAVFDVGSETFELMPRDTGGTPSGAQAATRAALQDGAEIILGPLFSEEVKAARPLVEGGNVNMIAFSTDWTAAGGNTFIMGFLPFDQIERVAKFAAAQNIQSSGIIAPSSEYGNVSASAWQASAGRANIRVAGNERFNAQGTDIRAAVERFTRAQSMDTPPQSVFIPAGGDAAVAISTMLTQMGMPPEKTKRLGTGVLDDQSLTREMSLAGAWFAAPSPKSRIAFERRYRESFQNAPPRLASLAYDATALVAVLARRGIESGGAASFDRTALLNPNGFAGIDGIFRFRPDGTAERGLAVLEIRRGQIAIIDEAPKSFR